jgi:hypothetical protein
LLAWFLSLAHAPERFRAQDVVYTTPVQVMFGALPTNGTLFSGTGGQAVAINTLYPVDRRVRKCNAALPALR